MNSKSLHNDAPTVLITEKKPSFWLLPQLLHSLVITDMLLFSSGLLSWPCPAQPTATVRDRGNFTSSPASPAGKVGQVSEGGQREVQDLGDSKPECFQRRAWS